MKAHQILSTGHDNLEEFYVNTTDLRPDHINLSTGYSSVEVETVDLAGIRLIWLQIDGRLWRRDVMVGDGLHFGLSISGDTPLSYRGRYFKDNDALVWTEGEPIESVMSGPLIALEIAVGPDLCNALGWHFTGGPVRTLPHAVLRQLVRTCEFATAVMRNQRPIADRHAADKKVAWLRAQVVDDLKVALRFWRMPTNGDTWDGFAGTRDFCLVNKANSFFDALDLTDGLSVEHLADALGVHRRSIFYAFQKTLGIGPRRYFHLRRLYALRNALRQAHPDEITVTEAASAHGFAEMGRLAGAYKKQFGELPSETLRRPAKPYGMRERDWRTLSWSTGKLNGTAQGL